MAPDVPPKSNKNVLMLLVVYTIIMLFSLYFVLRASLTNRQYHSVEYIRDNTIPTITHDRTITKSITNTTARSDTSSFDHLDSGDMLNCSLTENENNFWKRVQSVFVQTKGDYNVGNVTEYIARSVCLSGTSITEEQRRRLESITNAAMTNATTAETEVTYARPKTKKYYHSMLDDQKVFEFHCETCAMVSSSGRILGSKAGADIDNHTCVIRMNGAPSHGFEEDVGSRTTVRLGSFVMIQAINHSSQFIFGEERGEYNLYWGLEKKQHSKLMAMFRDALKKNGTHTEVYLQKLEGEILQNQLFQNMTGRDRIKSKTWLSTGWFTFQFALDACDKLDVYGMIPENYCSKNRSRIKYHYYQPGEKPLECDMYKSVEISRHNAHRFITEKAIFAKWALMYNVSFYHPTWNLSEGASKDILTPFMTRRKYR